MSVAGRSARREYEKRLAGHRRRVQRTLPVLLVSWLIVVPIVWAVSKSIVPEIAPWAALLTGTWLIKELWPSRRSVDAWSTGSRGEIKVARALGKLDDRFSVIHDRRIPGSRANIDHLVIGPTGIYVVETKNVRGKVSVRRGELLVNGRKRAYGQQARREAAAVQQVLAHRLADLALDVQPLICFVGDADLPWGASRIDGVPLAYPKAIVKHLKGGPVVLSALQIQELSEICQNGLLPA
jgi:hypothetical protein